MDIRERIRLRVVEGLNNAPSATSPEAVDVWLDTLVNDVLEIVADELYYRRIIRSV